MKVFELEEAIEEVEGFRVVFRARKNQEAGDYPYQRAAIETWSISDWINSRLTDAQQALGISVVDGYGREPHGNTQLSTIRETYA